MAKWRIIGGVLLVFAGFIAFLAYRSTQSRARMEQCSSDLKEFGDAYIACHEKTGKWPATAADMKPFLATKSETCRERVMRDEILAIWDAPIGTGIPGANKRTFAFSRLNFAGGKHAVLYQDLSVQFLTDKELSDSEKVDPVAAAARPRPAEPKPEAKTSESKAAEEGVHSGASK